MWALWETAVCAVFQVPVGAVLASRGTAASMRSSVTPCRDPIEPTEQGCAPFYARGIVNRVMRELGPIATTCPPFPLAVGAIAPLRAAAERQGSGDFSPLWAGQAARLARTMPAADLVADLMRGRATG